MFKEKYVPYDIKEGDNNYWNMMTFYEMKVINIGINQYEKAGKRLSLELEAPKLRKKFYLYSWESDCVFPAIQNAIIKVGDIISVHTEQSYYQDKSGKYCDAYRIVADSDFCGEKETPRNFKLMRIKREILEQKEKSSHLSKEEMLKMMLGD
jgi:hypothetical protein